MFHISLRFFFFHAKLASAWCWKGHQAWCWTPAGTGWGTCIAIMRWDPGSMRDAHTGVTGNRYGWERTTGGMGKTGGTKQWGAREEMYWGCRNWKEEPVNVETGEMLEQGRAILEKGAEVLLALYMGWTSWPGAWEGVSRKSWHSTKKERSAKGVRRGRVRDIAIGMNRGKSLFLLEPAFLTRPEESCFWIIES